MTETIIEAAAGGSEQEPVVQITVEGDGRLSLSEAGRALSNARKLREIDTIQDAADAGAGPRESGDGDEAAQESTAQAGDAASQETETRG